MSLTIDTQGIPMISLRRNGLDDNSAVADSMHWPAAVMQDERTPLLGRWCLKHTLDNWGLSNKRVMILIHGFNVDRTIVNTFLALKDRFRAMGQYDAVIGITWPGSKIDFEKWAASLVQSSWGVFVVKTVQALGQYVTAKKRVIDEVTPRLAQLLLAMHQRNVTMDVLAHSMGNRLILEVATRCPSLRLRNLFCIGPAVSGDDLATVYCRGRYSPATERIQNICIFYSKGDGILKVLFPLYEWEAPLGDATDRTANTPRNVSLVDVTEDVKDHSGYYEAGSIYQNIQDRVEGTFPLVKYARIEGGSVYERRRDS